MRERTSARELYAADQLVISLMGMSNMGKTMRSNALRGLGFEVVCCDDLIEKVLSEHLGEHRGISGVASWMNQADPDETARRQELYLKAECSVLELINSILMGGVPRNLVIDTTGSLVHTGREICERLRENSLMVYLEADAKDIETMQDNYRRFPKPVIFGEHRSYPKLLTWRGREYARHADITLERQRLRYYMSAQAFLELILCRADALEAASLYTTA